MKFFSLKQFDKGEGGHDIEIGEGHGHLSPPAYVHDLKAKQCFWLEIQLLAVYIFDTNGIKENKYVCT